MKLSFLSLLALAGTLTACGSSPSPEAAQATTPDRPPNVMYGHIESMTRTDGELELRFDPAWWLTGVAAQRANLEDTGSSDVPNDYRVIEEGHRLLTFVVSTDAAVRVLTRDLQHTSISADELLEIVNGRNPNHRRLFEPKLGFWIRIGEKYPNPIVALDQQYQP
jgi:hypothetical protein